MISGDSENSNTPSPATTSETPSEIESCCWQCKSEKMKPDDLCHTHKTKHDQMMSVYALLYQYLIDGDTESFICMYEKYETVIDIDYKHLKVSRKTFLQAAIYYGRVGIFKFAMSKGKFLLGTDSFVIIILC